MFAKELRHQDFTPQPLGSVVHFEQRNKRVYTFISLVALDTWKAIKPRS